MYRRIQVTGVFIYTCSTLTYDDRQEVTGRGSAACFMDKKSSVGDDAGFCKQRILLKLLYVATRCCVMCSSSSFLCLMVWFGSGIILSHLIAKNTARNCLQILSLSWRLVRIIQFCCHEDPEKCLNLSSRLTQLNTAVKYHNVSSGTVLTPAANWRQKLRSKLTKTTTIMLLFATSPSCHVQKTWSSRGGDEERKLCRNGENRSGERNRTISVV